MNYRLGIDVGTNSLGWAAVQLSEQLETRQFIDMGVRIFSDARNPKDKSSNAAQRRAPRGARRNRDRQLTRKNGLMAVLIESGLMPTEEKARKKIEQQDPWILRARALDEKLEPYQTGRALFHLNQRRGFKSNRKTDSADSDSGKIYDAIARTKESLRAQNARTLGELFGKPRLEQARANTAAPTGQGRPMPLARVRSEGEGAKAAYLYYPQRDMILDEFDQIWAAQAAYAPDVFTRHVRDKLRNIIEYQRPLKAPPVGKCTFVEAEPRAPRALPSVQRFRILQDINNLRVGAVGEADRALSGDERLALIAFLTVPTSKTAKRSFDQIRKNLGLPESQKFNLESLKRDHLVGDVTAAKLMQSGAWGQSWFDVSLETQDQIVTRLLEEEREDKLVEYLTSAHGLAPICAKTISGLRLPDGYGKLSAKAIGMLLPLMETGQRYDDAASELFKSHSLRGDGVIHDEVLPYYGEVLSRHTAFEKPDPKNDEERWGRVANPTVHVALNQIRGVINDLMKRYGPPTQIVLELARDLPLSDRGLKDLERNQKANQDANDARRAKLAELGVIDTYQNRLKLRLFEELPALRKQCVFTGQPISEIALFTDDIEIEHILPVSKTLNDSFANKVLATRKANRDKKNRAPYDAFGHSPNGYDWETISQRAENLPPNKQWRFRPNAMDRFQDEAGFLERQLNDTRYIARLARSFTASIYGGQGAPGQKNSVWVVPGLLTSDLRHFSGLNGLLSDDNRKDRTDHRHHAIDAFVVAMTDRSMVKRAADLAQRQDIIAHYEIMKEMAKPLHRYRRSVEDRLGKLTVSHKPDHGFQDAMHNDTAYGITGETDRKGNQVLVTRKPLDSFDKPKQLDSIRDDKLRHYFCEMTMGLSGKDFTNALVQAGKDMSPPVYKVRVLDPMKPASFVTITHGDGHQKAYKGDGNYCYDIWQTDKGKWTGEVITTFQAYQKDRKQKDWWRSLDGRDGQPLIMRIRKGDMLEIDGPSGRRCVVVYKFSKGVINMANHNEANASARVRAKDLPAIAMAPSALQKANAVRITVSPSGTVNRHKPKLA